VSRPRPNIPGKSYRSPRPEEPSGGGSWGGYSESPLHHRVPTPPVKSWKVLDFFSLKFEDLESPGKSLWSWKVLEIEVHGPGKSWKNCCHRMSYFKAKIHQIRFRLGLCPIPRTGELTVLPQIP